MRQLTFAVASAGNNRDSQECEAKHGPHVAVRQNNKGAGELLFHSESLSSRAG